MEDFLKKNPTKFAKDKPVYLTCQKGARGVSGASIFSATGYSKVINIDGGMNELVKTNIPI